MKYTDRIQILNCCRPGIVRYYPSQWQDSFLRSFLQVWLCYSYY